MQQPNFVIYVPWVLWLLSWLGAALLTNAPKRLSLAQDVLYRTMILVASVMLLFGFLPDPGFDVRNMLWQPLEAELGWVLVAVVVVAFFFAWWARIQLGFTLPGSTKKLKPFVQTGPYRWVRHPIYVSLIVAAFATACVFGRPSSLGGATLLAIAFVFKILIEEGSLRQELGSFDDYADRVPMLVPGLRFVGQRYAAHVPPLPPRPAEVKPVLDLFPPTLAAPAAAGSAQISVPRAAPVVEIKSAPPAEEKSAAAPAAEKAEPAIEKAADPPAIEKAADPPAIEKAVDPPAIEIAADPPAVEKAADPPAVEKAVDPPAVEKTADPPVVEKSSADVASESPVAAPAPEKAATEPAAEENIVERAAPETDPSAQPELSEAMSITKR